MHLIFLGTGPGEKIPRAGHTDRICRDARRPGSRSRRLRSSVLIRSDQNHLLIDASPDVLEQLERENVSADLIDVLCITHAHGDAAGGVNDLILARREAEAPPLPVHALPAVIRRVRGAIAPLHRNALSFFAWMKGRPLTPGKAVMIVGLPVIPFRVQHSLTPGFPTLGFRIADTLVYASDVASIPRALERYLRKIPHLVLDGCLWFGKQFKPHLSVDQSIALAERLGVGHLYLTQISHTYPPHDEAVRAIRAYSKKQKVTFPVTLAHDGLKIRVS